MPASKKRRYARYTIVAVELLGALAQIERKSLRFTVKEMADPLDVDRGTVQRLERGDPKIALGLAFEACAMLGIPLFQKDAHWLFMRLDEASKRLALRLRRASSKLLTISDDLSQEPRQASGR
jgi:DNA-binding XRE family transcriptional regulator